MTDVAPWHLSLPDSTRALHWRRDFMQYLEGCGAVGDHGAAEMPMTSSTAAACCGVPEAYRHVLGRHSFLPLPRLTPLDQLPGKRGYSISVKKGTLNLSNSIRKETSRRVGL